MSSSATLTPSSARIQAETVEFACADPTALIPEHELSFFWRDRADHEIWVACGVAGETHSLDVARSWIRELSRNSRPLTFRAFGWAVFDPLRAREDIWSGFPPRRIVLPRDIYRWRSGNVMAVGLFDTPRVAVEIESPAVELPLIVNEREHFSRAEWQSSVNRLKTEFLREQLDKVVLAERVTLTAEREIVTSHVVSALLERAPDATVFALTVPGYGVFAGASPERLFRMHGGTVEVESLAGTRPRGQSVTEDDRLSHELEFSRKERREQALVTDFVTEALETCCRNVKTDAPTVKRLPNVQHLLTRVSGELNEQASLDQLLDRLHPTPAVCGSPVDHARAWIHGLEPFDRGLYAGALGWVDDSTADWCVGIRSALIRGNEAHLFAGAGLVAGSDADQEYEECRWKMSLMRAAITGSDR